MYNRNCQQTRKFITLQELEVIWEPQMLAELLAILGYNGGVSLVETLRNDLIKTISILADIGWEEWSRFRAVFFPDGWDGSLHQERKDSCLPHAHDKLEDASFIGDAAGEFVDKQCAYIPKTIDEGSNIIIPRTQPLPFIKSKQERMGVGGFGFVTKEVIACHHFRPRLKFGLSSTLPVSKLLAFKVVISNTMSRTSIQLPANGFQPEAILRQKPESLQH